MKHIRDPLYGYISVSEPELKVIGTREVQRLRRIHQLGLSSAIYPGATHMRFEHSLGVMHLAGEMAESLGLEGDEVQSYRLAGLLHDVGHAPFSHATEEIMESQLGISHEAKSCQLVEGIADSLGSDFPANPSMVKAAIRGDSKYPIIAGEVDVDRMDYLRRDAQKTGIPHGQIDVETLIKFAEIHDGDIAFGHKTAVEKLFDARNSMTASVYGHHTSKIAESMLARAVEDFLMDGRYDVDTLCRWDDFELHTRLSEFDGSGGRLYDRICNRDLYKRACLLGEDNISREGLESLAASDEQEVETELSNLAGISREEIIVDLPVIPDDDLPDVKIIWGDELRCLTELSSKPEAIVDSEWRETTFGVYTPEDTVSDVKQAVDSLFF